MSGESKFKPTPPSKEEARKEEEARQNAAVEVALQEPIYFDGDKYWSKLPGDDERWVADKKEDCAANIKQQFSVTKPERIEHVLFRIRKDRRIDGVFPFIHNQDEIIEEDAGTFLNITRRKLMQPADEDGEFPWLDTYFKKIWDEKEPKQREYFLAWYHRAYRTAYEGNLLAGQALIIAGDTNRGKTLLGRKIIGASLGGFTDAGEYLLGKTAFNKEAAETAVWAVDDNRGGATWEKHDEFSNSLKRYVANPQIPYHPKFKDSTTVTWKGRIVVTCNLDAKSLSILPELDDSIEDKLMLFKLGAWQPDFTGVEGVIARELPFFLRWLLAWEPPAELKGDSRFGVKSYHHPDLRFASLDASAQGLLSEMLPFAISRGLSNDQKDTERWMTATEIRAMLDIEGLRSGLAKFAGNRLGIALSKMPTEQIKETRVLHGHKQYLVNLLATGPG